MEPDKITGITNLLTPINEKIQVLKRELKAAKEKLMTLTSESASNLAFLTTKQELISNARREHQELTFKTSNKINEIINNFNEITKSIYDDKKEKVIYSKDNILESILDAEENLSSVVFLSIMKRKIEKKFKKLRKESNQCPCCTQSLVNPDISAKYEANVSNGIYLNIIYTNT